jgi:hypothetical protein
VICSDVVETFVIEIEPRLLTNVSRAETRVSRTTSLIFFRFLLAKFTTCGVFDLSFKREMENDVNARQP